MNSRNKKILFGLAVIVCFLIFYICYQTISEKAKKEIKEKTGLTITLKGKSMMTLKVGDLYKEPGYQAIDQIEGELPNKVSVQSTLNMNIPGTYQITYIITNKNGEKTETKRFITVEANKIVKYQDKYDGIDNTLKTWWSGNKKNYERPIEGAGNKQEILKEYGAYYMGKDEKILYLTFDEGSNDTYTNEIVDVLNKNNVKATFFLCQGFIIILCHR